MIAQAAAAATVGLTTIVSVGVLFQVATLARLTVCIAWEQGASLWKQQR